MQLHSKAAILTVLILAYSLTAYGHTSAGLIFRGIASEPVTTTYSIPTNRRGLQLRAMEKSPVDGSMVVADHFESTPWAAHFVAAIRSHDVVVAGKNDPPANSLTIQRWTYCPPAGAYWIDRGLATSTPLGTAVSTPRAEVKVSGDRWTKPSLRAPMTVAKSTVYVGRDWSEIRDICADPDGRFLVILAKASSNNKFGLYQLSLDASQGLVAPTLIADETRYAAIADLSSIFPRDKEGYGRVYLSNTFKPSDDRIALMDPENDGASFVASAMTYAQYKVHPAVVSPDRVFTIIETP